MLSTVSKLADKSFVLGYLLPALLGVYAAITILHCPPWIKALCEVKRDNPFENLTYGVLAVWVVGVLLLALNHFAYRIIEGYLPPLSWIGFLKGVQKGRYGKLKAEIDQLASENKRGEAGKLQFDLFNTYPHESADFLPTRFGNAIRAFEVYPWDVYGVDGVVVWERLGSVIPSTFQEAVNDARSQVDFFVNLMLLACALGFGAVLKMLVEWRVNAAALQCNWPLLTATAIGSVTVAVLAYRTSLGPIVAWGDTVKAAFDCYLPALVKQLGYELPATESQRRAFWADMNTMFIYRVPPPDGRWTSAAAPSATKNAKPDAGGQNDDGDED